MLRKNTIVFIKDLKKNNVKEWFDANRKKYDEAKADFTALVAEVLQKQSAKDEDLIALTPKDCIFRINRDVRFSKDKSPYKGHFAAGFTKGGKKSPFAGYYLHIEPNNNSFVGGGLWAPETENLKKVRQEIDYSFDELQKILHQKAFANIYGDLLFDDETSLTRPPKGYTEENPAIRYLKLKSFIAIRSISDEELMDAKLVSNVTEAMGALQPLLRFINTAVEG